MTMSHPTSLVDHARHEDLPFVFEAGSSPVSEPPRRRRRAQKANRSSAARRDLSSIEGLLLMAPPGRSYSAIQGCIARAEKASRLCAAECSLVLLQDIFFGATDERPRSDALALLACAEACRLMTDVPRATERQLVERCESCMRACTACRIVCDAKGVRCAALAAACEQCEAYLHDLASALSRQAVQDCAEAA